DGACYRANSRWLQAQVAGALPAPRFWPMALWPHQSMTPGKVTPTKRVTRSGFILVIRIAVRWKRRWHLGHGDQRMLSARMLDRIVRLGVIESRQRTLGQQEVSRFTRLAEMGIHTHRAAFVHVQASGRTPGDWLQVALPLGKREVGPIPP